MHLTPKTYEEHLEYLFEIVKLKLCFLWNYLRLHENETFQNAFRDRVDIYRKTDINKGHMNSPCDFTCQEWLELEKKIQEIYEHTENDISGMRFEREAFEAISPSIRKRSLRDFTERPYVLDYQCGSLKYDMPTKENPQRITIHIANALAPKSIFDNPDYLPNCLMRVMTMSHAEIKANMIYTSTWLNSHPSWLALFPEEWKENMSPENKDIRWHFGFWGQFITARGTFNYKLGKALRETGIFPYWPRASFCSFDALRKHLTEHYKIDAGA